MGTPATIKFLWLLKTRRKSRSFVLSKSLPIIAYPLGCAMRPQCFNVAWSAFSRYDGEIFWNLHGWFLHFWWHFFGVFKPSQFGSLVVYGEESNVQLEEMSLHSQIKYFFGCVISKKRIEFNKAKIDSIVNLSPPKSVKDTRSFLGNASFYRHFIKDFSKIARPLTNLLTKNVSFDFTLECLKVFELLKKELTAAPIIRAPDWANSLSSCAMYSIMRLVQY